MKALLKTQLVIILLLALFTAQFIFADTKTVNKSKDKNKDIEGVWEGILNADGLEFRLVVHIVSDDDGELKGVMDSPDQGVKDIQIDEITLNDKTISFTINAIRGKYKGELADDGMTIDGTWTQGSSFPLILKKDPSKKPREIKERTVADVDPAIYDDYEGRYRIAPNFILTVTKKNKSLYVQATGQPEIEVFPESETKFFYKVVNAQITFVKDDNGVVAKLILHQNGRDMHAPKIAEE
jgi:hypothetical protein